MTPDAPITVTHFTTDIFAPKDRHEAWLNRDWPAIGPVFDARPLDDNFYNRSDRFMLGPVAIHVAEMGAQRYDRDAGRARRDGFDGLMVEILVDGQTEGDAAGRATWNTPGGMVFNDLAQGHHHVSSGTKTLLMAVPRVVAERNGIDVRATHGLHVSAEAAALLRSHLLATHAALPRLTTAQGERLGQIVLDLMNVALDLDGTRAPAAGREARAAATLLAAERLIADHLAAPYLSIDWLCGRLGVRRSTLYRLFEHVGGVRRYIRDRRLDRVAAVLADPQRRDRLSDLAERFGFSDASHLSRAFRERHGMAPGDYRRIALGVQSNE